MPLTRAVTRLLQPLLALGLLAVVLGLGSYQAFLSREVAQVAEASQLRLDFYRRTMAQTLEEFRLLPTVLGLDGRVRSLLAGPQDTAQADAVNRYLEEVSQDPVIHVLYLLDASGRVLASSNWREPNSFVGNNYGFRPYFHDAMDGRPGRFFGVGVTTQEAGYFLSAPVYVGGTITGVAVVKIRLDALEDAWRRSGDLLLVADRLGVVVLSSTPNWKFRSLFPLRGADREALARTRQYLNADLPLLQATDGQPILRAGGRGRRLSLAGESLPFVEHRRTRPAPALRIHRPARLRLAAGYPLRPDRRAEAGHRHGRGADAVDPAAADGDRPVAHAPPPHRRTPCRPRRARTGAGRPRSAHRRAHRRAAHRQPHAGGPRQLAQGRRADPHPHPRHRRAGRQAGGARSDGRRRHP
ncbi:cache domain-containing protein [Denitromonas sp.]|uniref:cache domain-containing protein n=1 Tax=Denitromonas sp. TaxID=2734609 RepID=UPI002AFEFBD9|nr:cache domain-containing protein [Denitromonas sp.]